jgi:YjbE family integral membrane protein
MTDFSQLFSWVSAVFSIVIIDLALSGDNAAVIGLAIRNLETKQRKKAAAFGAGGAIILRIVFTIIATLLLSIKYLSAVGGVILIFITWKLLQSKDQEKQEVNSSKHFWGAIGTIIIADLSMAFDNVMGVAGAAQGNIPLLIFGLLISIPILVVGSNWLATLMNKYPIIIYIGAGVLAHTALKMIIGDHAIALESYIGHLPAVLIPILAGLFIVFAGYLNIKLAERKSAWKKV